MRQLCGFSSVDGPARCQAITKNCFIPVARQAKYAQDLRTINVNTNYYDVSETILLNLFTDRLTKLNIKDKIRKKLCTISLHGMSIIIIFALIVVILRNPIFVIRT